MLNSLHDCSFCFAAAECMVQHAVLDGGNAMTSGAPRLFADILRGLSVTHLSYIHHWEQLLHLEDMAGIQSNHEVWTVSSSDRERLGRPCCGSLFIQSIRSIDKTAASGNRATEKHVLTLRRLPGFSAPTRIRDQIKSSKPPSGNGRQVDSSSWQSLPNAKFPLTAGDRVFLSLEKALGSKVSAVLSPPATAAAQHGAMQDLEDLLRVPAVEQQASKAIVANGGTLVEPNLTLGTVLRVSEAEIAVTVGELPDRLIRFEYCMLSSDLYLSLIFYTVALFQVGA